MEYPREFYINLVGEEHFLGRLTLTLLGEKFSVEIDIVQKESKKIFKHVDILYKLTDDREAIDAGVQRLAKFLTDLKAASEH